MSCFPCFRKSDDETKDEEINNNVPVAQPKIEQENYDRNTVDSSNIEAKNFTFRELVTATKNFRRECLLGEFGLGQNYKGTLQPTGEVVYVKRLDKHSLHGNKDFLVEVLMLSVLRHPNLLDLVGYCADGDQRLLVYQYMHMGSVEGHLLDVEPEKSIDWRTRMKIACGIAQGLEYLHETAKPPIIYRDLKCSNIMLDDEFNPKLSDHGLANLGGNNKSQMPVMGDYGYHAPEYEKLGELTLKSDVYTFGVVLLELITGRRAVDTSRPSDEQNLVKWAQPIFRDPKRFPEMADPRLRSFPVKSLNQVVGVAAMCLQDAPEVRPLISDVVATLSFLSIAPPDEPAQPSPPEVEPPKNEHISPPPDHLPTLPPDIKAPSRKESRRLDNNTDYREDSSESSLSDCDDNQHKYDFIDDQNRGSGHESYSTEMSYSSLDDEEKENFISSSGDEVKEKQQEQENFISKGHMDSVEYEVASMSSSSSNSGNESRLQNINKRSTDNSKSQHGHTSFKWKSRSTKRHKEERHEGITTSSSRPTSRIRSARSSSKGRSGHEYQKNRTASLSSKDRNGHEHQKYPSACLTSKGKNGHEYEKNHSASKGGNGHEYEKNQSARLTSKGVNGHEYEKNQSARLTSKGGNGHEYEQNHSAHLTSKGGNGHEYEKNQSARLTSKGGNGHEYEKNQSARLTSNGGNGHEYEKNQSARLTSKGENGHEYENNQSARLTWKCGNGHEYEKNHSARLTSKGNNGRENEKNKSMCSYSRESSIAGSDNGSDNEEFEEESLL